MRVATVVRALPGIGGATARRLMATAASTPGAGRRAHRGAGSGCQPPSRPWTRTWPLVATGVIIQASDRTRPIAVPRSRTLPAAWRVLSRVGCLQRGPELAGHAEGEACRRMPSIGVSFRDSATSAARRAFSRLRASTSLLRAVTDRGSGRACAGHVLAPLAGPVPAGAGSSGREGAAAGAPRSGDASTMRTVRTPASRSWP